MNIPFLLLSLTVFKQIQSKKKVKGVMKFYFITQHTCTSDGLFRVVVVVHRKK